ncbi:unnamed protein product [Caenorhabditis sp. 36 PRJEB53466]|nr:unnamed protein product [Caenorhabditis sp. 36 PRJEB53466]
MNIPGTENQSPGSSQGDAQVPSSPNKTSIHGSDSNHREYKTLDRGIMVYRTIIGKGGFGTVHLGKVIRSGYMVAIKLQKTQEEEQSFKTEVHFYKQTRSWPGFPRMIHSCEDADHRAIALELVGDSLEDNFRYCGKKFSLKTILLLADQMITRVEFMHSKGYIHRDLKPDNFCVGHGTNDWWIYLIDFGNVKRYLDDNDVHIPEKHCGHVCGTVRYLSMNAHNGAEMSRRDDMMALFNIFMYFFHGSLPWQGNKHDSLATTIWRVYHLKKYATPKLLATCPKEFKAYYDTVDKYAHSERPDYDFLRSLFRSLAFKSGFTYDYKYDWTDAQKLAKEDGQQCKK